MKLCSSVSLKEKPCRDGLKSVKKEKNNFNSWTWGLLYPFPDTMQQIFGIIKKWYKGILSGPCMGGWLESCRKGHVSRLCMEMGTLWFLGSGDGCNREVSSLMGTSPKMRWHVPQAERVVSETTKNLFSAFSLQTKGRSQQAVTDPRVSAYGLVLPVMAQVYVPHSPLWNTPCSFFPLGPGRKGNQEFLVPAGADYESRRTFYDSLWKGTVVRT